MGELVWNFIVGCAIGCLLASFISWLTERINRLL